MIAALPIDCNPIITKLSLFPLGLQEVPTVLPAGPDCYQLVRDGRRVQQRRPVRGDGAEGHGEALQVPQEHDTEPAAQYVQGWYRQRGTLQGHRHFRAGQRQRHRPPESEQPSCVRPAAQHMAATARASRACCICTPRLAV